MRARTSPLSTDFIGALNLLEVEFRSFPKVLEAWTAFLAHVNKMPAEGDAEGQRRWGDELVERRIRLLDAVARALKIKIDQLDILRGGYQPIAWANTEEAQLKARQFTLEILEGRRALKIQPLKDGDGV